MDIGPIVVVIGSVGVAGALLYFVPRMFSRSTRIEASAQASPVQVEQEAEDPPSPAPQTTQEISTSVSQPIYETVQPQTQPVVQTPSSIGTSFSAPSEQSPSKAYRRRSTARTRSTARQVHQRKPKNE